MLWTGGRRGQVRLHFCLSVQIADEREISNCHSSDLLPSICDSAQIVVSVSICSNCQLSAIQVKNLNFVFGDNRQILFGRVPQD